MHPFLEAVRIDFILCACLLCIHLPEICCSESAGHCSAFLHKPSITEGKADCVAQDTVWQGVLGC